LDIIMKIRSLKFFVVTVALLGAGIANAHPGHSTANLFEGLFHPLSLDHLLVMLAVGVWSVCALPSNQVWRGPLVFLVTLTGAAALGAAGATLPWLEHAVALTVVLSGVMLWRARQGTRRASGLTLLPLTLMGALHGLAHGVEAPADSFAGYAAGFLISTTVLHLLGIVAVWGMRRSVAHAVAAAVGSLGAAIGITGALLLAQLGA
jgi:urease accessory protein